MADRRRIASRPYVPDEQATFVVFDGRQVFRPAGQFRVDQHEVAFVARVPNGRNRVDTRQLPHRQRMVGIAPTDCLLPFQMNVLEGAEVRLIPSVDPRLEALDADGLE